VARRLLKPMGMRPIVVGVLWTYLICGSIVSCWMEHDPVSTDHPRDNDHHDDRDHDRHDDSAR
jgi:hypothetical protein